MPARSRKNAPFWETKTLAQMSQREWESLCDGCGRCCLHKVEDTDTGEIFYTSVACRLLNVKTARCRHYARRLEHVPDCIVLKKEHIGHLKWLPETCAYRRLDEGLGLPEWHPLITGDPDSVYAAGISVAGRAKPGADVTEDEYEEHLIDWIPVGQRTCDEVP